MARLVSEKKANFGTLPVFMTAVSTILGAILFLRFGYAVAHVGFVGVVGLIIIAHLVILPIAMAVAEIATNQRVRGGGAYYIVSRSFGLNIGAAIGIALYLSLIGAVMSFWLMFKMNTPYAILSIALMALFYYMISRTDTEKKGLVKLFRGVVFQMSRQLQVFAQRADKEDLESRKEELIGLICSGRIPISASNIQLISDTDGQEEIVCKYSIDADLTIIGFTREELSSQGPKLFSNYKDIGNILYVNSNQGKEIT
ncbi:MAG TPA: hypothetical protein DEQ09_03970 [Bacteroidales bacterium]|nr:hypothetical protein [Bacteroidales bacterium]